MKKSLQIAIADVEPESRDSLQQALTGMGHMICAAAKTGEQLVEHCRDRHPDLIVSDTSIPHPDVIKAASGRIPIILISSNHADEMIQRIESQNVVGCLIKPIQQAHLMPTISLAMRRFHQMQALRRRTNQLRQELEVAESGC